MDAPGVYVDWTVFGFLVFGSVLAAAGLAWALVTFVMDALGIEVEEPKR